MNRIEPLHSLRGAAAIGVVFAHAYGATDLPFEFPRHAPQIGVDIFFAISGFVMMFAHREQFGSKANAASFLRKRAIRIVPLYWLLTLLAVALGIFAPFLFRNTAAFTPEWVIGSLLFIPVSSPDGFTVPVLGVGWTLNYEAIFYVIFAAGMLAPIRYGLPFVVAALIVIVPSYPMSVEFLFGMAVAWTVQSRPEMLRAYRPALMLLVLCAIPATLFVPPEDGFVRAIAWGIPAAALVALIVTAKRAFGGSVLGDASYAIYLVQVFTLPAAFKLFRGLGLDNPFAAIAFAVALTIAAGIVLWYAFEKPALHLLRSATGSRLSPAQTHL
ncbi:acyltransferase [Hoeflea sp. G2-23]|uniref:Acyltransferase n=1 Tax=Hoeflea algicola TaxID=2983763 RepID=A0ABT3Z9F9_9HYPH|nr:acyltransferase [Hoeflea algicola]MCY0148321.1 acyltransferase [Hoeflea algicola]